jgi:hypothetical protein
VLSHVLVDARNGEYPGGIPHAWLAARGIAAQNAPLVDANSAPLAGAENMAAALLHLAL